jgi:hypothetical protein
MEPTNLPTCRTRLIENPLAENSIHYLHILCLAVSASNLRIAKLLDIPRQNQLFSRRWRLAQIAGHTGWSTFLTLDHRFAVFGVNGHLGLAFRAPMLRNGLIPRPCGSLGQSMPDLYGLVVTQLTRDHMARFRLNDGVAGLPRFRPATQEPRTQKHR